MTLFQNLKDSVMHPKCSTRQPGKPILVAILDKTIREKKGGSLVDTAPLNGFYYNYWFKFTFPFKLNVWYS